MYTKHIFGLFLLGLFVLSLCHATNTNKTLDIDYDENDDYDEYDDDGEDDDSKTTLNNKLTTSSTSTSTTTTTTTAQTPDYEFPDSNENLNNNNKCPDKCTCTDGTKFILCKNLNLTSVPKHLPNDVIKIDLSNNLISELTPNDFANIKQVREIILTGNKIKYFDKMVFANLKHLDHIGFSSNQLALINPNVLSTVENLKKICLNNNPIVIPKNEVFLNLPDLEELNLKGCNISELYPETFANLTGLLSLNLANNTLNENLDVEIFEPLKNLEKLQIPKISKSNIFDMCKVLSLIDVIKSDNYELSCFELASGMTFETSIVTTPPIIKKPTTKLIQVIDLPIATEPIPSTSKKSKPNDVDDENIFVDYENDDDNNDETILKSNKTQSSSSNVNKLVTKDNSDSTVNDTITAVSRKNSDITTTEASDTTEKIERINLSSQSIKTILIGIILLSVTGLMIGIIFRRDCCGIKTKLCRTTPRRPPPTDHVRPAEEVPLNKV